MVDLMIARCTDPVAAKNPYILAFPHHRVWHLVCGFCTDMLCLVFTERRACLASWPIISTLDILLYRIIHVMFISTSAPKFTPFLWTLLLLIFLQIHSYTKKLPNKCNSKIWSIWRLHIKNWPNKAPVPPSAEFCEYMATISYTDLYR